MSKRPVVGNDSNPHPSNKWERMPPRSSYGRLRGQNQERLSGGADFKSKSTVNLRKNSSEINPRITSAPPGERFKSTLEAEEEVDAIISASSDIISEKKVHEIIEYVMQNLHEAGKALASLGENFEQVLKVQTELEVQTD